MRPRVNKFLDLANAALQEIRVSIDIRFSSYPFVEDLWTGDWVSRLDYRHFGTDLLNKTSTVEVRIRCQEVLMCRDREALVDLVLMTLKDASDELAAFISE